MVDFFSSLPSSLSHSLSAFGWDRLGRTRGRNLFIGASLLGWFLWSCSAMIRWKGVEAMRSVVCYPFALCISVRCVYKQTRRKPAQDGGVERFHWGAHLQQISPSALYTRLYISVRDFYGYWFFPLRRNQTVKPFYWATRHVLCGCMELRVFMCVCVWGKRALIFFFRCAEWN